MTSRVLASLRTCDIEQASFGLVDVVEFGLVGSIGGAFVEREDALVTGHYDDRAELKSLRQAHRLDGHRIVVRQSLDRRAGASKQRRMTNENNNLDRCYVAALPGGNGAVNGSLLVCL